MSIVVCDGRVIASDSQYTDGNDIDVFLRVPKFEAITARRKPAIVAAVGNASWAIAFREWAANRLAHDYPLDEVKDSEPAHSQGILVTDAGPAIYTSSSVRKQPCANVWAMGSGRQYAMAALCLGFDAVAACRVASQLDTSCSAPIFAATLDDLMRYGSASIKEIPVTAQARIAAPGKGARPAKLIHARTRR